MAIKESGVKLVVENLSGFLTNMDKAIKAVKSLETQSDTTTKSLKQLDTQLKAVRTRSTALTRSLTTTERRMVSFGSAVAGAENDLLTFDQRTRSSALAVDRLSDDLDGLQTDFMRAAEDANDLNSELRRMASRLDDLDPSRVGQGFSSLNSSLDNSAQGAAKVRSRFGNMGDALGTANEQAQNLGASLLGVVSEGLTRSAELIGGVIKQSVGLSASYEDAFAGVTKTVNGLSDVNADGIIELTEAGEQLRQGLIDISNEAPVLFEDLAGIAELGGQLGITVNTESAEEAQEVLLAFTETVAGLAEATNLTQEAAATSLAQISNIYGQTVDDMGQNVAQLGDAVVALGNNSATTEKIIVSFASRLAGAGATAGLTQDEVLGIGAAFASIGIAPEAGGTAVSKALLQIQNAANASEAGIIDNTNAIAKWESKISDSIGALRGLEARAGVTAEDLIAQRNAWVAAGNSIESFGEQLGDTNRRNIIKAADNLERAQQELAQLRADNGRPLQDGTLAEFLKLTELTKDEFVELQRTDPAALFQKVVEGVAAQGENASKSLKAIGLGTAQAQRAFLGMANNTDVLADALQTADDAFNQTGNFENQSALAAELEQRYATLTSRVTIFQNKVRNTSEQTIGQFFIPSVNDMLGRASDLIPIFGERLPQVFDALVGALEPLFDIQIFEDDTITDAERLNGVFDLLIETISGVDLSPVASSLQWFIDNGDTVLSVLKGLGTGLAIAGTVGVLTAAIGALVSPLGLLTAGVVALTVAWDNNFLGIQDFVGALGEITLDDLGIADSVARLEDTMRGLSSAFSELWDSEALAGAGEGLATFGETILTFAGAIGGLALDNFLDVSNQLAQGATNYLKTVDALLEGDYEGAQTALANYLANLAGIPATIFENLTGFDIVEPLQTAIRDGITGLEFPPVDTSVITGLFDDIDFGQLGDTLGGLKDTITDIFADLDLEPVQEGFGTFLGVVGSLASDFGTLAVNVGEFLAIAGTFSLDVIVEQVNGVLTVVNGFAQIWDGVLTGDTSQFETGLQSIGEGVEQYLTAPIKGLEDLFNNLGVELPTLDFSETSNNINSFVDDIQTNMERLQQFLSELTLDESLDIFDNLTGLDLSGLVSSIEGALSTITGLFEGLTFELPELPNFTAWALEQVQGVTEIFASIDLGVFGELLPTDLLPDLSGEAEDAKQAGKDVGEGLAEGIEEGTADATHAALEVGQTLLDAFTGLFEINSPSEVTKDMGQDLINGLLLPFSSANLSTIQTFASNLLNALKETSENVFTEQIPVFTEFDEVLISMYSETYPQVTSAIVDDLIPAKETLTETNIGLTDSTNDLNDSQRLFGDTLNSHTSPAIENNTMLMTQNQAQVDTLTPKVKILSDEYRKMANIIKRLAKQYQTLAAAITAAANAGGSLAGAQPSPPVDNGGGGVPSFAKGGRFVVPQNIPYQLRGNTGGMLIEVHPQELVEITPRFEMPKQAQIMNMPTSGGFITNQITNTNIQNERNQDLHLHVNQAVSGNVISSFDLLRSLA